MKFVVTRKDLEITFFSSGKGGQHQNKHNNFVRIKHKDTGVIVTGQEHRERPRNMKLALQNLAKHWKFKWYCEQKLRELEGEQTIEQTVEEAMRPENIVVTDLKGNEIGL